MSSQERIRAKLERMAYFAFTEIRMLVSQDGMAERITRLVETAELIPEFLTRGQQMDLDLLLGGFEEYGERYGGFAKRYLQIWNMNAAEFDSIYAPTTTNWPQPAMAIH